METEYEQTMLKAPPNQSWWLARFHNISAVCRYSKQDVLESLQIPQVYTDINVHVNAPARWSEFKIYQ